MSANPARTLCIGDALVDFVGERPGAALAEVDGAILRGALRATAPGAPCRPVNTAGSGDVLTGTLLARLALSGFYESSVAASLPEAIEAAARACERWGAVD